MIEFRQIPDCWQELIMKLISQSSVFGIAIFNHDGDLFFINKMLLQLSDNSHLEFSLDNFSNPNKKNILDLKENDLEPVFVGEININFDLKFYSFPGMIYKKNKQICILLEYNLAKVEEMNQSLLEMNRDISNLQRELIKKKKMLENANQDLIKLNDEKNKFIGIAAHDLRNPISSISIYSDFILTCVKDSLPEKYLQVMDMFKQSSDYMLTLLEELLEISKIESGKVSISKQEVNYRDFIINCIKLNQIFADNKSIKIVLIANDSNQKLMLDKNKIMQVMNNLISNALKYSHSESSIEIKIEADQGYIKTSVIDYGVGIKNNEISQVFQPFQKTSSQPTAGEKCTGLGMSITKNIIEIHGGEINILSEEGKGTVVHFTLPLK